jgi:serine/threonine-protein kinase RsbW
MPRKFLSFEELRTCGVQMRRPFVSQTKPPMAATKKITFSSVLENIHVAENLVDEVCAEYRVKEDYYGEILISITEAVNNAIVHGNKLDTSKSVTITFEVAGEKSMRFTVEDEGPGFDYSNLPDPTAPENIEKPHGRGVFLMRNLADRCSFEDSGRVVVLDFDVLENQPA